MTPYDQVAAVLAAATPGPWTERPNHRPYHIVVFGGQKAYRDGFTTSDILREDARFIALARNTYPELLAVARAAEAYVRLHDTMNYPETAAMYPADLRTALSDLEAKIREVMP
jgi:hypothetical protein